MIRLEIFLKYIEKTLLKIINNIVVDMGKKKRFLYTADELKKHKKAEDNKPENTMNISNTI